jgi:putative DNA primase/helicase
MTTQDEGKPDSYSPTDDGNALRLVDTHGERFRRISDMRRWYAWDGQRWAVDHEDRAIRQAARMLARSLPQDDKAAKQFKRMSMTAMGITSAVRVSETDPRIAILAANLDSHPELLNTPNGVVSLRAGLVCPHEPRLMLSRITSYGADLEGIHPRWSEFLKVTFDGDTEVIDYMQRIAGLALIGNVRDHILPFFHGVGANGKGTFILVMQGLLGDADRGGYSVSAPDGFLMSGREGVHPTEIARLRGARLVVASEQSSGKSFDEVKVKRLTGGDMLTGRFMRGDFFDFVPAHLIIVLSNHLPKVTEGGPAFWRRVRRILFGHVMPEHERNPDLHSELLADEGAAILGWAVRGAMTVLTTGMATPDKVLTDTEDYEVSEDSLKLFIRERCLLGQGHYVRVDEFRQSYVAHCGEIDAEPLKIKSVSQRLASEFAVDLGHKVQGKRIYRGIGVLAEPDAENGQMDR